MAKQYLSTYIAKLKEIRPFVTGFSAADGYDIRRALRWTPAQKAQITRYAKLINEQAAVSSYVYRPRRQDHLRAAQRARGVTGHPKLKVAFMPTPPVRGKDGVLRPTKPDIRFSAKGEIKITVASHGSERDYLLFEDFGFTKADFVQDPEGVIEAILAQTDYRFYNIITGEYEYGKGAPRLMSRHEIIPQIKRFIDEYANEEKYDPEDSNSSFIGNWLFGLLGYRFTRFKDAQQYVRSQRDYANERKAFNRRKRQIFQAIERLEKEMAQLKRYRRINERVSRLAQRLITAHLKRTRSEKIISALLEARRYIQTHRDQQLPDWLRGYVLAEKQGQIDRQNELLSEITRERLQRRAFKQ